MSAAWPELPYAAWKDTCATLQLWTQIVGKVRLALTPWLNHSWHVTLYVTARGLTTAADRRSAGAISRSSSISSTMCCGCARSDGHVAPAHAAADHGGGILRRRDGARSRELGIDVRINEMPNEIPGRDSASPRTARTPPTTATMRSASGACCCASHEVFSHFRTGFLGKASPVHFFWGSFDLAVTRFSGRRAPLHPGGVPHLPDAVAREAYSHEVSSAGFWPGGGGDRLSGVLFLRLSGAGGLCRARVRPAEAFFSKELGEFILPYDAVRTAPDPDAC